MRRLAPIVLALAATAGTAAAAPDPIAADLAAMKPAHAHPLRVAFLGWTRDHLVAYRGAVCSEDAGGGRGPYCAVTMCTSAPGDVRGAWSADPFQPAPQCAEILSLDLNSGEAPRKTIDAADVRAKAAAWLDSAGALDAGKPLKASAARVAWHGGDLEVTVAGWGAITIFRRDKRPEAGRSSARHAVVETVTRSSDGACVAVVGHLVFESAYEGVPVDVPWPFAETKCNLPAPPIP